MSGSTLLPFWPSEERPLFDFDFTSLSLGALSASSFLTATAVNNPGGLTFTRSTVSTVQTSASTVDSTPAVNDACIGNIGSTLSKRGLVLQHRVGNRLFPTGAPRDLTNSSTGWQAGTGTLTINQVAGPDSGAGSPGSTADRENTASNQYSNYGDLSTNASLDTPRPATFSAWVKDHGSNGCQIEYNTGAINTGKAVVISSSSTWQRAVVTKAIGSTILAFAVSDSRDFHLVGGRTATAADVYCDLLQYENTAYVTEANQVGHSIREDDRLSYATGSDLIAQTGQFKFYARITPKWPTTLPIWYWSATISNESVASAGWYLYAWGTLGQNYAKFGTDNKLRVKIANGTEATSTNAIVFAQYDDVEIYVAVGNGIASVAQYRVNGGSWTDLVLGTISNTPAPGSNPIGICFNLNQSSDDKGQPPCWLNHLTIYGSGQPP